MKRFIIAATSFVFATPAFAIFGVGDITFDPSSYAAIGSLEATEIAKWAEAIKYYEDMILQQEKMLNSQSILRAQLGDWQGVYNRAMSIKMQAQNLKKNYGKAFNVLAYVDYGAAQSSLTWTNGNQYAPIPTSTYYGTPVQFNSNDLKRYKAVENLYEDANESFDESDKTISSLLDEISATADLLGKAKTQAEVQTYSSKLEALKIALDNERIKRREKIDRLMATKAINDNQREKEHLIRLKIRQAENTETQEKYKTLTTGGSHY